VTVTPQYIRNSRWRDPADRSKYLLGILREIKPRGSLKIHQMLHPGHRSDFAPATTFDCRGQGRHLLLAGGIGVTP